MLSSLAYGISESQGPTILKEYSALPISEVQMEQLKTVIDIKVVEKIDLMNLKGNLNNEPFMVTKCSFPNNIELIIPDDKERTLYLVDKNKNISYATIWIKLCGYDNAGHVSLHIPPIPIPGISKAEKEYKLAYNELQTVYSITYGHPMAQHHINKAKKKFKIAEEAWGKEKNSNKP